MAIAFVNVAFSTGSTTAGNTKNITYTSTAGNTIIVFGFAPGTARVTNVTDTANNVYYPRAEGTSASVWSTEAGAAKTTGSITITVSFSASIRNTCCAVGYSGVTGIGKPLFEVTGSSNAPSASFTTQNNNNVFVAGMGATGTGTWSLTTGTALRGSQAGAGATTPGGGIIDNTSATPASVTCTAGLSSSESWGVTGIELTTVQASIDSDDSYWQNRVAPVPATNLVPNQWQFDPSDIVPAVIVPTYSRAITIDHTKVGGSDLTDYVALVKDNYPFLATVANGGLVQNVLGYDVVFYSDSALTTRLNWQVENYNADGDVIYWVRIPSVSHTVDTTFYIAYGSSLITTDQSNTFGTWNISNGPAPLYHLYGGSFADSHGNNLKPATGNNSPGPAPGAQIGTGTFFDNNNNQNAYVLPAADPGGVLFPTAAGSPGSVSFWVSLAANQGRILYQDGAGHDNFNITCPQTSSSPFTLNLGSASIDRVTSKTDFLLNTLYKLDFTWNASNLIAIYVNGVLDNSYVAGDSTSGGPAWSTTIGSFAFGATPTTGNFFNGILDELRVYPAANSADFITCSYNNEASPSSFYSIGQQRPGQALEDDSWWSSVMQSGATVALATALSIAAMTGVANSQPVWQDEVPQQTTTTLVMEEDAAYLPPPIQATLQYPQQWSFDTPEDITHIDEDYWAGPPPVQATNLYPQQWPFDEQISAGNLFGQPDEDYWRNPVAPVAATLISPTPASFDEQIPAGNLRGQPDEDYWANPTAPTVATLQWPQQWSFDEQIPAGLFGVPEEVYWQNQVPPAVASLLWPQQWPFSEELIVTSPPQFDEDFWVNPAGIPQVGTIYPQQFQFDTPEELAHLDEDFWQNQVTPVQATLVYPQQADFDEQIPAGNLFGQPEEDYWINPVAPVQAALIWPQQWPFDDQTLAQLVVDDEGVAPAVPLSKAAYTYQQWFGADEALPAAAVEETGDLVRPRAWASNWYPQPWDFTQDESLALRVDEIYGFIPTPVRVWNNRWLQQAQFDEQTVPPQVDVIYIVSDGFTIVDEAIGELTVEDLIVSDDASVEDLLVSSGGDVTDLIFCEDFEVVDIADSADGVILE